MSETTGRLIPQNLEAEKSVLGAILIDESVISDIVTVVKPRDFYESKHQAIFDAMLKLFEKSSPIDLLTLTDQLKKNKDLTKIGGSAYLAELTNYVPTASHAEAYAKMVAQASTRRRLIKASSSITDLAYEEGTTVDELLGKAEKEIFSVSDSNSVGDLVSLEDILTESFDRIEALHKNQGALRGVSTGYRDLDNMTAGFLRSD